MGGYASERDGDYYTCICGESSRHSYLTSSRDGYIAECCENKGWEQFHYGTILLTKKPGETQEDAINRSKAYNEWYTETDWERYYKDKSYRKARTRSFQEMKG
jgi:hypothetical protein